MSMRNTKETEREAEDSDQEINPCTVLLVQEHEEGKPEAIDDLVLHHHQQTFNLESIKSAVVIRQLPSQGLSFQLWPAATAFVSLLDRHDRSSTTLSSLLNRPHLGPLRILELGSGTGLVGIAAAAILGAHVTVTDLSHVIPNLKFNAEANMNAVGLNGGKVEVAALGWGVEKEMEAIKENDEYDVIMGSDVVYHDHLYNPLLQTLKYFLLGDRTKKEMVFVMSHLKRWKKESVFFKKAKKDFDVEVIHKHDPCDGSRVGVLLYTFVAKNKKKKVEVAESQ
ncbi:uncharacterized protein LOC108196212 [Daucus carota subsp. sativus]|nr:PREDICTED: protein N-lysine methyltransferase METTL21A-like [Daucus carota subsp. sativus]